MQLNQQILEEIGSTIASGYYERNAPVRKEKKSLLEAIESAHASAELPVLAEVATAMPDAGLLLAKRSDASELIDQLSLAGPTALSLWVEPRYHAGDIRWLAKDTPLPILCKDWIIDTRQIVGGDAVLLNLPLIRFAGANEHELIEAAHEQDMEAVIEVYSSEQLTHAKSSEADIIAINNHGTMGNGADINVTVQMLSSLKTGRPVISMRGITNGQQVRTLITAGATAVELSAHQSSSNEVLEQIKLLKRSILGKDPQALPIEEKAA